MSPLDLLCALPGLALTALIGRLVLSLLPAGEPGLHGVRDLPATWASAHFLGLVAVTLHVALLAQLGVEPSAVSLLAPWLLPAVIRLATLPGAMAPRHEPRQQDAGPGAHVLALVTVVLVVRAFATATPAAGALPSDGIEVPFWVLTPESAARSTSALQPTSYAALLILTAYGLRIARRAPLGCALFTLALAATPNLMDEATRPRGLMPVTLFAGAATCYAVGWLRRADRRARALAILALAGAAGFERNATLVSLAGFVALVAATPRPARASTAAWSAVAWLGASLPMFIAGVSFDDPQPGELVLWPWSVATTWTLVAAGGLALRAIFHDNGRRDAIEPPGRELVFCLVFVGLALAATVAAPEAGWPSAPLAGSRTTVLLPTVAVLAGLLWIPAERPDAP